MRGLLGVIFVLLFYVLYPDLLSLALRLTRPSKPSVLSGHFDIGSLPQEELKVVLKRKIRLSKLILNSTTEGYMRDADNCMLCCPFHSDNVPSMSVGDSLGMYHCFACGEKGDVFKFIQKQYEMQYGQTLSFKECLYRALQIAIDQDPEIICLTERHMTFSDAGTRASNEMVAALWRTLRDRPQMCAADSNVKMVRRTDAYIGNNPRVHSVVHKAQNDTEVPVSDADSQNMARLKRSLKLVNHCASVFFQSHLFQESREAMYALSYLQERGLKISTIIKFRIGFAPRRMFQRAPLRQRRKSISISLPRSELQDSITNDFRQWLTGNNFLFEEWNACQTIPTRLHPTTFTDEVLFLAGLTLQTFRGRLIIPILDEDEAVIGFGARLLSESAGSHGAAKYVNTPTTPVYRKRDFLYGLHSAQLVAKEVGAIIIVEGYFDVLSMYEIGLRNVVASMGTAISVEQLKKAAAACDGGAVILLMDNDAPGHAAVDRVLDKLKKCIDSGHLRVLDADDITVSERKSGASFDLFAASLSTAESFLAASPKREIGDLEFERAAKHGLENYPVIRESTLSRIKDCSDILSSFNTSVAKAILEHVLSSSKKIMSASWTAAA